LKAVASDADRWVGRAATKALEDLRWDPETA
jgi:hypothetical protein